MLYEDINSEERIKKLEESVEYWKQAHLRLQSHCVDLQQDLAVQKKRIDKVNIRLDDKEAVGISEGNKK